MEAIVQYWTGKHVVLGSGQEAKHVLFCQTVVPGHLSHPWRVVATFEDEREQELFCEWLLDLKKKAEANAHRTYTPSWWSRFKAWWMEGL